jgi:regulation of enolase protein 1 (concanavalin A-like superfamily)
MSRLPGRLVMALALVLVACVFAEDKKPQEIKGWGTVVDADGDCRFEEKDGTVTITVPKTNHDLTYQDEAGRFNAPRILREVEGDFTIEVKVPKFPLPGGDVVVTGPHTFVSAGLLIWQDEKNFFRIERAAVGTPPFAYVGGFRDGKSACHELQQLSDTDTIVRAERKGNKLTFAARAADAANWSDLFSETYELPAKLKVGVESVNTINRDFPAKFQELKLVK